MIMTAEVILSLSTGVSESTKQALLELLCFYNCEDTLPEDLIEERWFRHGGWYKAKQRKTWK
jgi:pentatricopeptide repeat domain-containing protein 3